MPSSDVHWCAACLPVALLIPGIPWAQGTPQDYLNMVPNAEQFFRNCVPMGPDDPVCRPQGAPPPEPPPYIRNQPQYFDFSQRQQFPAVPRGGGGCVEMWVQAYVHVSRATSGICPAIRQVDNQLFQRCSVPVLNNEVQIRRARGEDLTRQGAAIQQLAAWGQACQQQGR